MLIQKRIPHYMLFHFLYILLILIKINCFIIFFLWFSLSTLILLLFFTFLFKCSRAIVYKKGERETEIIYWITYIFEYLLLYNIDDEINVSSFGSNSTLVHTQHIHPRVQLYPPQYKNWLFLIKRNTSKRNESIKNSST